MQAAHELIETAGEDALTMAAIAERAGVARRTVYLHFASCGDVVNALFEHLNETEDQDTTLQRVWDAPGGAAALDAWARVLTGFVPRIMTTARAVQHAARTDPYAAQLWHSATSHRYATCRRLMERLAEEGLLADRWTSETATDMLLALTSHDVFEVLLTDRRWPADQLVEHLSATFRATFLIAAVQEG
jgi:AcrR family transcriptional regulator